MQLSKICSRSRLRSNSSPQSAPMQTAACSIATCIFSSVQLRLSASRRRAYPRTNPMQHSFTSSGSLYLVCDTVSLLRFSLYVMCTFNTPLLTFLRSHAQPHQRFLKLCNRKRVLTARKLRLLEALQAFNHHIN